MVCPPEDVEVVISGVGGYFPRANNIEELTKVLMDQVDCIGPARWKPGQLDVCDKTGNVDLINYFDASYFGIHRQQAIFMDPMQRMLLQNTLEALIDAGVSPVSVRGRRILVAIASSISENDSLMFENVENGFGVTGQARTMMANRISYWLNVTGPSYACDASWLGGLMVLQHGYDAVRTGQCEAAIVGAANLAMNIYPSYLYKCLNMTSPDGTTRPFDENANGYARSDGMCVLFLQRADQARRHYASVINADVMFNGFRTGQYIDVDVDSARRFISDFYKKSGVNPAQINYVETYGCGIRNLDKMELQILDEVYNEGNREKKLMLGAVKSNVGHSEASCALTSIVKVLIAMETGVIPGNLHKTKPRSDIPSLAEERFKLLDENTPWDDSLAAINGFGLASAYGHALLRRNPVKKVPNPSATELKLPLLHILSTRTEEGIKEIIEKVKSNEEFDLNYMHLINDVFATNIPSYLYRGYLLKNADGTNKEEIANYTGVKRPIWFIYSGMGSQWLSMGKTLLDLPIFARAVDKCCEALKPFNVDLMHILTSTDPTIFDSILHSFVGIAAVQIGLTDILTALGITPDGILGHSVGELGCAYADGCLTAEQMILSAYYRGRASEEAELIPGLMAAVGIGATEARKYVTENIDIACHNGPDSCTLSGPKEDMEEMVKTLQGQGIFAKLVNVAGIAYHSRYIKPAAPLLRSYLEKLIPNPKERSSKWASSSVPQARWNTDLARYVSAEYLTNNLLSSVLFEEALKIVPKGAVLIEIAPHGLLQAILKRSVHADTINIALTKRAYPNSVEFLLTAIGKMYNSGLDLNIAPLYEDIYPKKAIVPRGTPSLAPLVRWAHTEVWRTGLDEFKDYSSSEQTYQINSHGDWCRDVVGHKIFNTAVIPGTIYLPLVCEILSNTKKVEAVEFSNVSVKRHRNLPIREEYIPPVRLMVQRGTGMFEASDRYGIVTCGQAIVPEQQYLQQVFDSEEEDKNAKLLGKELYKFTGEEVYRELKSRGLELTGLYQIITELQVFENGVEASIIWKNNWAIFATAILHIRHLFPSSSPNCLVPGYIRQLVANFENLPQEGTLIKTRYTRATDNFWSPFLIIRGAVCIPPIGFIRPSIAATSTKFIPQEVKKDDKIDVTTIVDACLQTINRQVKSNEPEINVIIYKDPALATVRNILKEASKENVTPKINVHIVDTLTDSDIESLPSANLLVMNANKIENLQQYIENRPNTHVLLYSGDSTSPKTSNLIEILSYEGDNYKLQLLKQINNQTPEVINIDDEIIDNADIENMNINWVRTLELKLSNSNKRVYIAFKCLPNDDVNSFVRTIEQLKGSENARFLFILDKNAPKPTATEPFYAHIYQQDIKLAVYSQGKWGSRFTNSLQITEEDITKDEEQNNYDEEVSPNNISVKVNNVDVRCIGIHSAKVVPVETEDGYGTTQKLGLVDYCGVKRDDNTKVMGICNGNLQPDKILQWPLPENWSFIDGATVPAAYAVSYYTLVELATLSAGETVLIHNACSAVGQAMIRVAYSLGAKIFATVGSERQKAILLNSMRMLTGETIFDYSTPKFEMKVLSATQGVGVDVLINCFQGDRLLAGLRCIATLGRAILLQNEKDPNSTPNTDTIGLGTFFRCVGMYGVHPSRLCELSEDVKRRIHELVQSGIDRAKILPIRRNVFRHEQPIEHVLRYVMGPQVTGSAVLQIQNDVQPPAKQGFQCDSNKTYIVYGDNEHDIDSICQISIWLAKHGAKNLLLIANPKTNEDRAFLQRNLGRFNIKIDLMKSLPAANKLNNVAAIIILPEPKNLKLQAVPSDVRLVYFTGTSSPASIPQHTLRSTLRQSKRVYSPSVIHFLGLALSQTVDLVILGDENEGDQIVDENFTYKDYFRLLAGSAQYASITHNNPKNTIYIEQVTSSSPRHVIEVPPLFIIPGLMGSKCKYLRETISNIMCPVYVINAINTNLNVEQNSIAVAKRLREQYPTGPYNIAAVSTGGILALEVAKNLEEIVGSNNVQLYMLDAVPATLQHLLQEAHKSKIGLDGIILQYLLQITDDEELTKILSHKTWDNKLNAAFGKFDYSNDEIEQLTEGINIIREQLLQVINFVPNERILNAPTKLLHPDISSKDLSYSLNEICKQLKVEVFKGNHFTILQAQNLMDYINEHILLPPIYTPM